jgi:hypothetical protein
LNFEFYAESFEVYSVAKKEESVAKSIKEKEEKKVLKRALQRVQWKEYHKIIAEQAISRKKGCRGNNAGDGPAAIGSVKKNLGGNFHGYTCINIYMLTYIHVCMNIHTLSIIRT